MPIRRHGKGWEVRVQHGGRRFSKTVATRSDALAVEGRIRQRINDRRAGRTPSYTVEEAVRRWLEGDATLLRSHANLVNKFRVISPHIKGRLLEEIADVAEDVKVSGLAEGLKPATINRRLALLRRVARLAQRQWDWLERDVAAKIRLLPGEEPRQAQATPAQIKALMTAAAPRTRQAIVWAVLTGLRKGEVQRVKPESFQRGALVLTETKTGRPRVVPLAPGLRPAEFPFGLTDNELARDFRAARAAAGLPWLQFRDLRRTCGSWIVQRTKSLKAAQDLLGHTSIAITARHYAHLLDEHVREAVNTLPRLATGQARGRRVVRKKRTTAASG
jgi:integrase